MRKGGDISFIPKELMKVRSAEDSGFVDGKFYGSLVALLGATIGKHLTNGAIQHADDDTLEPKADPQVGTQIHITAHQIGETCPKCNQPTIIHQEGCDSCTSCNYSRCF